MIKIEIPIDTPTKFELGDIAADIQKRREEREQTEGGDRETTEGEGKDEVRRAVTQTQRREWLKKDKELRGVKVKWYTEGVREASKSQLWTLLRIMRRFSTRQKFLKNKVRP